MSNTNKSDIYDRITDRIITLIESHQASKFSKCWLPMGLGGVMAQNPVSGIVYTGINQLLLCFEMMEKGYKVNKWLTFKQVAELKGNVIKGSKATEVVYTNFVFYDKDNRKYTLEQITKMQREGKNLEALELRKIPFLKQYYVFNVAQTENLPAKFYEIPEAKELKEFEKNLAAEELINSTGANVIYQPQDRAFYRRSDDVIILPIRAQFKGAEPFYSVIFHELGHWTGHKDRLNREFGAQFGDTKYAFEELVAELCTAFICAELGFSSVITNNAAYLANWLQCFKNDTSFIVKAASSAHKAAEYIKRHAEENSAVIAA